MRRAVRTVAIDVVEVELGRPGIHELIVALDFAAEMGRGVERHIVVDELAEIGVAGRDFGVAGRIVGLALLDHRAARARSARGYLAM